jgi:hypothetical protein
MKLKQHICGLAQALLVFALALTAVPAWPGSKYGVLHNFTGGGDGGGPTSGPLLLDQEGRIYGETAAGGGTGCRGYGCGLIFELTMQSNGKWQEKVLYEFPGGKDGAIPIGSLVLDAVGNLYGTTRADGGASPSTVFKLSPHAGGWSHQVIYEPGSDAGLILDKTRNLYGFIGPGGHKAGAVSELVRGSKGWNPKTLYSFCSQHQCADGEGPGDPLAWAAAGNLYGTTLYGGNSPPKCPGSLGCGVAFQMMRNSDGTWKYKVLHRFAAFPTDGQYPDGGLAVDTRGNAYGVTGFGGVHGNGTVFKLTLSSGGHWKQTVLYDFPNCGNGCSPYSTLVFDKAGNLYGTGSGGLADCQGYTCGLIFKLSPQAGGKWKYSVVHKFTGTDGGFPNGVIIDAKGNLYGTTQAFGKYGYGVAFEITP